MEKFGEKGEEFDPTKHEAILHKPDAEAEKETVDTVVEAGYRIGDRVIRAARVVVAPRKTNPPQEEFAEIRLPSDFRKPPVSSRCHRGKRAIPHSRKTCTRLGDATQVTAPNECGAGGHVVRP